MKKIKIFKSILIFLLILIATEVFAENNLTIKGFYIGMSFDEACDKIAKLNKVDKKQLNTRKNLCIYNEYAALGDEETGKIKNVGISQIAFGSDSDLEEFSEELENEYNIKFHEKYKEIYGGKYFLYKNNEFSIIVCKNKNKNKNLLMIIDEKSSVISENLNKNNKDKRKPFQMSPDNINAFVTKLEKALNNTFFSPKKDKQEEIINIYKNIIENEMGFNLDKTIRSMILFDSYINIEQKNYVLNLFSPLIDYIIENKDDALSKNIISEKTHNILSIDGSQLSDKEIKLINYIIECQKENKGTCNPKSLLTILSLKKEIYFNENESFDTKKETEIFYELHRKYDIDKLKYKKLIIKNDGKEYNINLLCDLKKEDNNFVINQNKYKSSLNLTSITKEEMDILFGE